MKTLLIVCLLLISTIGMSQITSPPSEKQLVADETWVVASGKSSFRIICTNDSISHFFTSKKANIMTKVTISQKRDRHGYYWERSFYFKNEYWNNVVIFINNNFK